MERLLTNRCCNLDVLELFFLLYLWSWWICRFFALLVFHWDYLFVNRFALIQTLKGQLVAYWFEINTDFVAHTRLRNGLLVTLTFILGEVWGIVGFAHTSIFARLCWLRGYHHLFQLL